MIQEAKKFQGQLPPPPYFPRLCKIDILCYLDKIDNELSNKIKTSQI